MTETRTRPARRPTPDNGIPTPQDLGINYVQVLWNGAFPTHLMERDRLEPYTDEDAKALESTIWVRDDETARYGQYAVLIATGNHDWTPDREEWGSYGAEITVRF